MSKAKVQFATIANKKYAYVYTQEYPKDRPLLVFLHEGLGSIEQWKDFPFKVQEKTGCDVLIYDRNGYGQSDPLKKKRGADYLHRAAMDELPKILNAIAPDREYIFWGHSDGGSIALLQANVNSKCLGVITEAAHVIVEDVTLAGIQPAIQAFEEGKLAGLQKYHGDKTETIFYAWAHTWLAPSFADWDICDEIISVSCPILAIQGENDQYGSEEQLKLIKEYTKGSCEIKEITNCGHAPHVEQLDEVLALGVQFINTI